MTNVGGKVERRETGKVKGEQLAVRGKRFCSQLTAHYLLYSVLYPLSTIHYSLFAVRWAETGGGNERFC